MTFLSVKSRSVTRGKHVVLNCASFDVDAGELIGLIGPNGAGKTTLMRSILGLVPSTGTSSLADLSARERGRAVAWMPQAREIAWPINVETLVGLGRTPHIASGRTQSASDKAAVDVALGYLGLEGFRSRIATQLSGGEQARVLLARALAQETPLLMADEPTAGLDPSHQISTMQTFTELTTSGKSVILSLHDLGLAARYCTRLIVIDKANIVADGTPAQVLTPDLIRTTFGITAWHQKTDKGVIFQPLEVIP